MEKLFIEATDDRPAVLIDPDKPLVKISGSSFPENAVPTYSIVIDWLRTNGDKLKNRLICEFHFDYINSASKKSVYEMFFYMRKIDTVFCYFLTVPMRLEV